MIRGLRRALHRDMAKTIGMGIKIGNMQKLGLNAGKVPKRTQARQRTWQKTSVQQRSR